MSEVSLSPRYALSLAAVVLLSFISCRGTRSMMPLGSPCPSGGGSVSPNFPLICIDENLNADPSTIRINARMSDGQGKPTPYPVMIQWWTRSGTGNLGIEFQKKGCVDWLKCDGSGHCWGPTKNVSAKTSCDYTVNLEGRINDPTIIIQPCCAMIQVQDVSTTTNP